MPAQGNDNLQHAHSSSDASSSATSTPQSKPVRSTGTSFRTPKSQPVVGVSPTSFNHYRFNEDSKMAYTTALNDVDQMAWHHARGNTDSNNSSPGASEGQVPSMTTGSTSASVESLESVQDQHQRRLMQAMLDEKFKAQKAVGGKALVAQPPTSFESSADGETLVHSEFGYCNNQEFRYTSEHLSGAALPDPVEEEPGYFVLLATYISYLILIIVGHCRDFVGKRLFPKSYRHLMASDGYAALNSDFDSFYTRRLKLRLDDCFSRPVTGVCGRTVVTLDRKTDDFFQSFRLTGEKTRALNISAYNYLGYAQSHGGCAEAVLESLKRYGVSSYGSRLGAGSLDLQTQAEKLVAQFVGQEDAMIISMGFATNSTTIPAIARPGTLIISDELNHASIRFGARLSGAHIRQYKHNDMDKLESLLRECISQGMPRTHRPWKAIVLMVEGLYSMEGTLVNLPRLLQLKRKYKFYLYIDEAHSIGAIGPNGRGICDYFGINPRSVDLLMGTFTKSFGAAGGYISGRKEFIDRIRLTNHANIYGETLAPPVLTQIIASMAGIMGVGRKPEEHALLPPWVNLPSRMLDGSEGRERLRRLAFNARYLSSGLRKLGFIVYGHRDSPIVPLLVFHPGKMPLFSRMMLDRSRTISPSQRLTATMNEKEFKRQREEETRFLHDPSATAKAQGTILRPPIVVVVVAYPATPLISSRVRYCVSAAHNIDDIQSVLRATDEVGTMLRMKYGSGGAGGRWDIEEVMARPLDLVKWDGTYALPPQMT
jgi:serine palmitoyltransferase